MPVTSLTCRSLFTGDSGHTPTNKAPSRLQAGSYLSLRGLLVVLALSAQLSALNFSAHATELTDLGQGLAYLRIHTFDDNAQTMSVAIREREYFVLDLRHAAGSADSAALLGNALAAREAKTPVFILVGPATPPAFVAMLSSQLTHGLTLGVKDSLPLPQVVIDQPREADQRAYQAAEEGEPLAKLISGKIGKERYDEAALMKEFLSGNSSATPPAGSDSPEAPAERAKPAAGAGKEGEPGANQPARLVDRVLQRAVHLHRALIAIRQ